MSFLDLFAKEQAPKELQCGYCSNLLSVPGVTVPDDQGNLYACGRCSRTRGSSIAAAAYEAVAPSVKFPCRYNLFGCNRQISWGGVLDHEKACDHRVYDCITNGCDWQGPVSKLKDHVLEKHQDIIIKNGSLKIPMDDVETLCSMIAHNELFLIQYCIRDSIFCLSVKYVGKPPECGRFTYEAEIKDAASKSKSAIKLYSGKLKPLADYIKLDGKMDVKLKISSLDEIFNTRNVNCYITILEKQAKKAKQNNVKDEKKALKDEKKAVKDGKKSAKDDKKPAKENSEASTSAAAITNNGTKSKNAKKDKKNDASVNEGISAPKQEKQINESMVRELECPVCQEYMLPPIFLCSLGHSVCGECKHKLLKCPTCSSEYGNTRNYTLESMLQLVQIPCRNVNDGCSFIGNLSSMQIHMKDCEYDLIKCPVSSDCKWRGSSNILLNHLRDSHKKNVFINLNEVVTHNLNVGEPEYCFLKYGDDLYKISCKHGKKLNSFVQWSFQRVLSGRKSIDYKIEIDFLDQTANNRKFVINHMFGDLAEDSDNFSNALAIPISLLQPFVDSSKILYFKYNIYT